MCETAEKKSRLMADGTSRQEEGLGWFVEGFPTQLDCMKNNNIRVFWSQNKPSPNDSSSDWVIHEKIKSAFCNVNLCDLDGLIQFWAPVKKGGRRLLTTCDQPFALEHLYSSSYKKYRLTCIKYEYSIEVNTVKVEAEEDTGMIISGAPAHAANAFLEHLPKQFVNLRSNQVNQNGNPLTRSAMECALWFSVMMPVFDSCESCVVGVVECSSKQPGRFTETFSRLTSALEKVGLTTSNDHLMLCKDIPDIIIDATIEAKKAVEIACQAHHLSLAQAWFDYGKCVGGKRSLRYAGFYAGPDDTLVRGYYNTCEKTGSLLVHTTLSTYAPVFCRNINELEGDKSAPANTHCSCFVICLRTIANSNTDFAFQFLWPKTRNYFILLESLLSTLKRCLPSFKLASGAQLCDELSVVDVTPQCFKRKRRCNSESCGPKLVKREYQIQVVNHSNSLPIKAQYGNNFFTFYLPISSVTLGAVRKVINQNYGFISSSLEFLDESNRWIFLLTDQDLGYCIQSWRIQHTKYIQLRVLPPT